MKIPKQTIAPIRRTSRSALAVALISGIALPVLAAAPAETKVVLGADASSSATTQPAQKCMSDLRAFDAQMQTDGYWLHGSGFGYGYPIYGYGYGFGYGDHGALGFDGVLPATSQLRTRPGYEVRTLVASANILAERGQQQACDVLLGAARDVYKGYATALSEGKVRKPDGLLWRRQLISAALPVTGSKTIYRSDLLIGADVVNGQGVDLGDVFDVVLNPQTGGIAYLVIGRGGLFGIGEKHVPVPWEAFKASAGGNLMVLDTTKANMDAAPRVAVDHFSPHGSVGQQGQSADAFWKGSLLK